MSIGRSENEKVTASRVEKIGNLAVNSIDKIYRRPASFLFFAGFAALMVALFIGHDLPWQYYGLLALIGVVALYAHTQEEKNKEKK